MLAYAFDKSENMYALNVVQEFFAFYSFRFSIEQVEGLIYYALHWKYYKEGSPYNIVFFGEELRKVIVACFVLAEELWLDDAFEVEPGEKGLPDLSRTGDYMPADAKGNWLYVPRYLSIEQYLMPMKALQQMRKYKTQPEWMKAIDELIEYALSRMSIDECLPKYNMMKLRRILLQMTEACYLIVIRYRGMKGENGL